MAHIRTYARIKPSKRSYDDYEATQTTLYVRVPDVLRDASGQVRTRMCTVNHEFKFTHVFNNQAPQEEVFDVVARNIIDGFLNGYNGTIFAYGQTGSGKTFTVEGSARLYEDRGLAPRALSMIYKELEARDDLEATVHVSYMEIYQEVGYDLLNQAARSSSAVTPFPKVAVVEGAKGSCIVRNLSSHLAANEDVAQSLLLQGQANRKVAETPMNQRSSRSHAVLTIILTAKKQNSEITTKSKLHLVDLAGSERVSKTGINGQQLAEAKYINLSLHHLEGVIIALHQEEAGYRPQTANANYSSFYKRVLAERSHPYKRPRSSGWPNGRPSSADGYRSYSAVKHVPYRNSLLTMLLKDSLGGNCQTAMIATVSVEEENLSESLSTCRFAQRVACITNTVRKNEEIDDKLMIKRLRKRIAELETELALLKSGENGAVDPSVMDAKLTEDDRRDCARIVQSYLGGQLSDPILAGITTPLRFRECMKLFKTMVKSRQTDPSRPYNNNRPLNAWTEVQEPSDNDNFPKGKSSMPRTVPTNMKIMTSGLDSSSDTRTTSSTQLNTSSTLSHSQTTLNTSGGSQHRSERSADTSHRRSQSASSLPLRPTHHIANDIDHRMSQMSLVPRDYLQSRGSSPQSRNRQSDSRSGSRASSRSSYKSPFERKREKTIKLLADQVRQKRNEQQDEQEALRDFQVSIRDQQLTMVHAELSLKADENKRQLDEQHAHVKQIKAEGVDEQLYTQEKLIERQLRKRQAKMEKRLALVEAHMELVAQQEIVNSDDKNNGQGQTAEIPADPTKMKGYGTVVNSRLVLDRLEQENRKQEKKQTQIEHDRVLALSQQIELKEAATRQKLRDLKQKMKEGKMSTIDDHSKSLALVEPRSGDAQRQVVDLEEEPVKDINQSRRPNDTFKISFKLKTDSSLTSGHPQNRTAEVKSPQSLAKKKQPENQELFQRKEPKKNFDDLWSKSYSSSRQNSAVDDFKADPFSTGLPPKLSLFGDVAPLSLESCPVKAAGYEDLPSDLTRDLPHVTSGMDNDDSNLDLDLDLDTDHIPSREETKVKSPRDIMKSLEEAAKQSLQRHSVNYNITPQHSNTSKSHRPIRPAVTTEKNRVENADDVSRMGGTHKTFESALQSMLAMEGTEKPGPLTIQQNDYDEFARSNRQDSSVNARTVYSQRVKNQTRGMQEKPRRKETPATGGRGRQPISSRETSRPVTSDAWGPEVKNMSMSDRLARFLDTEILPASRPKPGHGHSYEDADAVPYRKPRVIEEAEPAATRPAKVVDLDADDYKPRIKALPEKKREAAYMSTVREQKDRVTRIRRARRAAEVIQRAWHKYSRQKRRQPSAW